MLAAVDWSILEHLNGYLARHDAVEDSWVAYVDLSEVLFLGLLAWLFFATRGNTRRSARHGAIAAGLSSSLALSLGLVISHALDRPRPFVEDPGAVHLFTQHAADAGFPSDHATAGFAIAVAILLRNRRYGILALVMATVLAVGRVAVGVHFPSDVAAGALLGTLAAFALYAPPIRGRLHALADRLGAIWDGFTAATLARLGTR
jgi:undecaprenyl-diphosphatase